MGAPPYVADPFAPRRRATREVRVGDVGVGGKNPIRVQSMTTTDTLDTAATLSQLQALAEAGCEIARVTTPSLRDAENLAAIRRGMRRLGLRIPLVADVHFTPKVALISAEHADKVRINPGNYADKKRFEIREYSDAQYAGELERVAGRFRPLVRRCKQLGVALRIGTNHGSLSDRILSRHGDTPRGMVESALEFLDVCEDEGFGDVVFSMKASNPQVAIQAYRLLVARLAERAAGAPGYPLHLGVTEAGDGEDGRIKSAIGIGALLEDGIGDTIRVSLTEDPVREVPVARALARRYDARLARPAAPVPPPGAPFVDDPFAHTRRASALLRCGASELGGGEPVRAELELGRVPEAPERAAAALRRALASAGELACEGLRVDAREPGALADLPAFARGLADPAPGVPLVACVRQAGLEVAARSAARAAVEVRAETPDAALRAAARAACSLGVPLEWTLDAAPPGLAGLVDRSVAAARAERLSPFAVSLPPGAGVHAVRLLVARLRARDAGDTPVVLRARWEPDADEQAALLAAAVELGVPLCDGIGDAVSLSGCDDPARALDLLYRILQGARQRSMRTEFISCPSCGRTLFDLEQTTARVKARTQHLPGVKIAVMGCIVNGPGEMADADFGYVGSGPGLVNLYAGKQVVERHVPEAEAPERLVDLIRRHGRWIDPA